ncbi:hypothetical protein, partial [Oleidesulfovibrio sp.]|uniref:hypothetical protein n=1 Tax=Oleidesulfovibrio sp. TaxID=2909707 RepID=UPI003A8BD243
DFCLSCSILEKQFTYFESSGSVSFAIFNELQGTMMNKGLLWRLKDTAHHLFGNDPGTREIAPMIDWSIGYIFHECVKLKEDAYQHERYAQRYRTLSRNLHGKEVEQLTAPLASVLTQTQESMNREVQRIRFLLEQSKVMLCNYYESQAGNRLLARLLHDRDTLVRSVFGHHYDALLRGIYEDKPERLYIQAGESLVEGGRYAEAAHAAAMAVNLAPECEKARLLHKQAVTLQNNTSHRRAINA